MTDFKQLKVWQKAHELTLEIYRLTSYFPQHELYGLSSQMRRCAVSIGSNIAEGRGRDGDPDFQRVLGDCDWVWSRTGVSTAAVERLGICLGRTVSIPVLCSRGNRPHADSPPPKSAVNVARPLAQ